MKKTLFIKSFFAAVTSVILLSGCATTSSKEELSLEPIEIDYVSVQDENITFTNLPQVELMELAGRFAGLDGLQGYYTDDNSYLEQMQSLLGKHKDADLVRHIKELSAKGVTASGIINLAYHIKPDFSSTTVPMDPKPYTLNPDWEKISSNEINTVVKELHDFAQKTNYTRIYALNRSDALANVMYTQQTLNKYKFYSWHEEFFTNGNESEPLIINCSRANASYSLYDFALNENNQRTMCLSFFPGEQIFTCATTYSMCFIQDYTTDNWDKIKDSFILFLKNMRKKINPENSKEIDKQEITSFDCTQFLAQFPALFYIAQMSEEIDETPGVLEEGINGVAKTIGEKESRMLFDIFFNYKNFRGRYPSFKMYYLEMNDGIHKLGDL